MDKRGEKNQPEEDEVGKTIAPTSDAITSRGRERLDYRNYTIRFGASSAGLAGISIGTALSEYSNNLTPAALFFTGVTLFATGYCLGRLHNFEQEIPQVSNLPQDNSTSLGNSGE